MLLLYTHAAVATTWNPSDNSDATLTNGNMTATFQTSNNIWHAIRGTTSRSSGKWHFEVTIHPVDTANQGWITGVADSSASLLSYCGHDTHGIGWEPGVAGNGAIFQNGAVLQQAGSGTANNGDVLAVEVDVGGKLIWFANITQASGWTNASAANTFNGSPAAGTGGASYTATNPVFIGGSGYNAGGTVNNQLVLNIGPSFSGAVSSGFSAWG